MWGPVFSAMRRGRPLVRCMKDFYAPDQYSVLAIARNVQDGHRLYSEPFSTSGTSVYPSAYYYTLGKTAEATDTSVVWAWNVVGIVVSCALLALSVWWARRLAPGTRAWVLAPLPFLMGTLTWWQSHDWIYRHSRSVLWPPVSSLYSPGAENPALVLAGVALLALTLALSTERRRALRWSALAGVSTGLSLHAHANVAVFAVVAAVLIVLWDYALTIATPRRRRAMLLGGAVLALAAALAPASGFTTRIGMLVVAAIAVPLFDQAWRRRRGAIGVVFTVTTIVSTLPLSIHLASQALRPDSYFAAREASVAHADTNLPVVAIVALLLPLWVLVLAVGSRLVTTAPTPDEDDPKGVPEAAWFALLAGLTTATLLLTMGGRLGAQGLEWHRFTIYGPFLCAMAAAPGLWLMLRHPRVGRERVVGVVAAVFVLASLPTTFAFASAQRGAIVCVPAEEVEAYVTLGRAAGPEAVLLLDRCFRPGDFKVYSGSRVASYNYGIAAPPDPLAFDQVLDHVDDGELAPQAELRAIGVTRFVTNDRCNGVSRDVLRARYGEPTVTVALARPAKFGFPNGLTYEMYDITKLQ